MYEGLENGHVRKGGERGWWSVFNSLLGAAVCRVSSVPSFWGLATRTLTDHSSRALRR